MAQARRITWAAALLWMPLATSMTAMAQQPSAATTAFHSLVDEAWEADMRDDPLRASYLGDRRYESEWPDTSLAAIARRNDANVARLARLHRIDRAALPSKDQLSYDLFEWDYKSRVGAYPFKPFLYEVRPRDGVQTLSELAELIPFTTVADYEHWITRLKTIDRYLTQYQSMLEVGIREKRTQPRVVMERVLPQLANLIKPGAEANPFYAPFKRIPDAFAPADRTRLQAEGKSAVENVVIPAYAKFEKFFRERYLPATRATDGIWDTPDGLAFYQERARFHTTTDLTPDQIHEIGLKEVARIRAEMDKVIREVGFKGSFSEFLAFLRTDPRFYYKTRTSSSAAMRCLPSRSIRSS